MTTNQLWIDTNNQSDRFLLALTKGTTPSVRANIYSNGTAISLTATNTAKFIYAVNKDSTPTEINGVIIPATNYITFTFTELLTSENGKFFASIILYDTDKSTVLSDGILIIKRNPITN